MNLNWLVWKDYRVNRLVFITALVLLVFPYLFAAVLLWRGIAREPDVFLGASLYALGLLQLTLAFMGGNAIAGERADRSAEFFASLPVPRARALASKLLVTLGLVILIWLPNLAVMAVFASIPGIMPVGLLDGRVIDFAWRVLGTIAITGLTFFCVAWLLSSVLESATFSVCAGLIVPLLVILGIVWTAHLLELRVDDDAVGLWYGGLCMAISAIAFPSGTAYYLRRIEP